jgi:hypothetical protein
MLRRLFIWPAACAVACCAFFLPTPSSAYLTLNASWLVSYFADPSGVPFGSQCVNFVPTGRSNGVESGVFNSPTLPGWTGTWVQKGEHFSWYGTFSQSGATYATFDAGDLLSPRVAAESSAGAFNTATGATLFSGTATLTQVKSCPDNGQRVSSPPARPAP